METADLATSYDAHYFASSCGPRYTRDEPHWKRFFGAVADRIVADIAPATALDAGCAIGFLVEELRARGVDAYGFDASEYAISQVPEALREVCWVGSVTDPLPRRYDLIVCIEVLEHVSLREAEEAVRNFAASTDDVLFSSTPFDHREATHITVRPPEHWAELFARHGLFRDVDFDASFVVPWARRFRRRNEPVPRLVAGYERSLWRLENENHEAREALVEQRGAIARAGDTIAQLDARIQELDRGAAEGGALREELARLQARSDELRAALERAETELASTRRRAATADDERRAARARAEAAERNLAAMRATRTFRYTAPLRRRYGAIRAALHAERRAAATAGDAVPAFLLGRAELAERYLHGSGIEIGALHQPLAVPPGVHVRYVDRMTVDELRAQYPELAEHSFVEPDVLDDGESLATIADASVDFVIANHFIEHCENPIAALVNHLRVLRTGGVLYMAAPDKRKIFDRDRPETPLAHLLRDYSDGPQWSRQAHFEEYAALVDKADDPRAHARTLMERRYSIHFHVWTPNSFRELLAHCRRTLGLPFELVDFRENDFEFIAILAKTASADA